MAIRVDLLNKIKKGGEAEVIKDYLREFVQGAIKQIFDDLSACGPDHLKLLEIQAEAKVIKALMSKVDVDIILARSADQELDRTKK